MTKFLFGLGALAIFVMLQINLVENSQKSDLTLGSMVELAQADDEFDPCPVDPIPWHCAYFLIYDRCAFTNLCVITCPEPCCWNPGC